MRDPVPTSIEGVDRDGEPAHVRASVRDDGRIDLVNSTPPGEPVVLSPEATAHLRNQLGDVLTIALREARTARRCDAS